MGAPLYTSVLGTAGLSPDQFGAEIVLDLPNKSVFMGQGGPALVNSYLIAQGETLSVPKIGARTLTAVTRGTNETAAITFNTISDTAATFTKRFAYDAWEVGYPTRNDMPPDRLASTLNGVKEQATMAIANDVDSQLLSLYASASSNVGGAGADFSIGALAEGIEKLKVANAPGPYYAVLPSTQWAVLAQTQELIQYSIRGVQSPIAQESGDIAFNYAGVKIFTTGNVPVATGTAHGLIFSAWGIRMAIRDMATVKEWEEPANLAAVRMLVFEDFAYVNTFSDWIVDFQCVGN